MAHNQETAVGILFGYGTNSDKPAPNMCLVACKPEAASGDAKDCPYHFLLHIDQVKCYYLSLVRVPGDYFCGLNGVESRLREMWEGCVSAWTRSCPSELELLHCISIFVNIVAL